MSRKGREVIKSGAVPIGGGTEEGGIAWAQRFYLWSE